MQRMARSKGHLTRPGDFSWRMPRAAFLQCGLEIGALHSICQGQNLSHARLKRHPSRLFADLGVFQFVLLLLAKESLQSFRGWFVHTLKCCVNSKHLVDTET